MRTGNGILVTIFVGFNSFLKCGVVFRNKVKSSIQYPEEIFVAYMEEVLIASLALCNV